MSIIYDALKKVEASKNTHFGPETNNQAGSKKNKPGYKFYLYYFIILCSGFLIASILFNLFTKSTKARSNLVKPVETPKVKPERPVILEPEKQSYPQNTPAVIKPIPDSLDTSVSLGTRNLVLNGIFFSQDEGYALINNRIVKEGDKIDNLTVVRITAEEVELDNKGLSLKLSTRK